MIRITLACVGFWSAFAGMPVITALCMFLLSVRYAAGEVLLLGMLVDILWLPPGSIIAHPPLFTLYGCIIVWAFAPLRARMLFS